MNSMSVVGMFPHSGTLIPRFREAGYVTLDLLHRDGRIEDRWIGLSQREFELVWRLAAQPGERMTRYQLFADIMRLTFAPPINRLAIEVAGVRSKLGAFGLDWMLANHPDGGYFLDVSPMAGPFLLRSTVDA